MPIPENASTMGAQTVLEHLIQNDVISENDIYDDLTEEVADIIFSVITLAISISFPRSEDNSGTQEHR